MNGRDTILVVVNRLSKSTHFLAFSYPYIVKIVAKKFVQRVVKLHGMPHSIVSNHDRVFISHFWHEFFKMSRTQLQMSFTYHP